MQADDFKERLKGRFASYGSISAALAWLEENRERVNVLFESKALRDFVFEPIRGVFELRTSDTAGAIRQTITKVAVANAVLAGLPGKLGIGVLISLALEAWMAWEIASRVGIKVESYTDLAKYFGLLSATAGIILIGFKELLSLAFSMFSVIPWINPLIAAELAVTNLVGVMFWVAFEEAKTGGTFKIPFRAATRLWSETRGLLTFQWSILKNGLNPANLKTMSGRLGAWLSGDVLINKPHLRGEVAVAAMMATLLAKDATRLSGPLGQEFLQSIRDRFPQLANASLGEMSEHMRGFDADQMAGVISSVKGKLFERMVILAENSDGDGWTAVLHEDQSYPGTDMILTSDSGEVIEVSLKATGSPYYIEEALRRYPDVPILSTDEVATLMDNPSVTAAGIALDDVDYITQENFDQLLDQLGALDVALGAAAGTAASATLSLWPFVVAYMRKRITMDQLQAACIRVSGGAGRALASRVGYAVVLGPIFAWYLLARGAFKITDLAVPRARIVWKASSTSSSVSTN